jgi:aspartyl-tRNA(Asn)/glutamyl-tRNA(Gln) amidotransferase subunit C
VKAGPEKIDRQAVERIAQLAALAVDQDSLPRLTEEIARIIEYVSQIEAAELPPCQPADFWLSTAPRQPLRPDTPSPARVDRGLETIAPAMKDGFFVVPRLRAMED